MSKNSVKILNCDKVFVKFLDLYEKAFFRKLRVRGKILIYSQTLFYLPNIYCVMRADWGDKEQWRSEVRFDQSSFNVNETIQHRLLSQFNEYLCCNQQQTSHFISFFFLISFLFFAHFLFFMYSSLLLSSSFTFTTKSSLPFPVLLCFLFGFSLVCYFSLSRGNSPTLFFINWLYLLLAFLFFLTFPPAWLLYGLFLTCWCLFLWLFLSLLPVYVFLVSFTFFFNLRFHLTKYFHTLLCMLNLY